MIISCREILVKSKIKTSQNLGVGFLNPESFLVFLKAKSVLQGGAGGKQFLRICEVVHKTKMERTKH